jgi:hypothetical protein
MVLVVIFILFHYPLSSWTSGSKMKHVPFWLMYPLQHFVQIQKGSPLRPFEGEGIDLSFLSLNSDDHARSTFYLTPDGPIVLPQV